MDIKNLLYIITISQEGSLSRASRKLSVSQPTLSVFLTNLETNLGVDLFSREKKRLIPTPAGNIYINAAKRIIQVKDQTYQAIHRISHELTETITVGATPLRGSVMIAQIFPAFSKRFPDVKIEIRECYMKDIRTLIKNGTINCALGTCFDRDDPDFDHIIIAKEEVILAVPAFHPLAPLANNRFDQLVSIDIQAFADSPFVLLSPGATIRAISDNIFSKAGFSPTIVFETNNALVLSNMIRQGVGVGFLPRSSIVRDADDIVYFSLTPQYYLELCIFVPKNKMLSEAECYFAYLVFKRDQNHPIYLPSRNTYSQMIIDRFEEEDTEL